MQTKNDFVTALLKEISLQRGYLEKEPVETIYFGGGTPSLLTTEEVQVILGKVRHIFPQGDAMEVTLEANPDDIARQKVKSWKRAGINRVSIGVQSFSDVDLRWMNRAHQAAQALNSIELVSDQGLEVSIDLIYGTPTLSDEQWRKNVETAIACKVSHLSCYALTVEPRTALQKLIQNKKLPPVDTNDQARQFQMLMKWMRMAGYEHYEISNFALPGHRSRHNAGYWQGKKYLGLGPSAHSYNGHSRQWNVSNNIRYVQSLAKGELLFEKEELTSVQVLNEYIMTALRTMEGVDLDLVARKFGPEALVRLMENSGQYMLMRRIEKVENRLVLTDEGRLFADGIAADLFFEILKESPHSS